MDNALNIFNYNGKNVRVLTWNGEIWFIAKDIARILSLGSQKSRNVTRHLNDEEKTFCQLPTSDGVQRLAIINLAGFYSTVERYNNLRTKQFTEWVLLNVLQTLKKNGSHPIKNKFASLPAGALEGAKIILELSGLKGKKLALALDKIYQSYTGISAFEAGGISIEALPD